MSIETETYDASKDAASFSEDDQCKVACNHIRSCFQGQQRAEGGIVVEVVDKINDPDYSSAKSQNWAKSFVSCSSLGPLFEDFSIFLILESDCHVFSVENVETQLNNPFVSVSEHQASQSTLFGSTRCCGFSYFADSTRKKETTNYEVHCVIQGRVYDVLVSSGR